MLLIVFALLTLTAAKPQPSQKWYEDCGLSKYQDANPANPNMKVVNGIEARQGEYPWQVALTSGSFQFCGGNIIAPNVILTAAHCVGSGDIDSTTVIAGAHDDCFTDSCNAAEPSRQIGLVSNVIGHESYPGNTGFSFDYALLSIYEPFTITDDVRPVCRPSADVDSGIAATAGFGTGNVGGVLNIGVVDLVTNDFCLEGYPNMIDDTMICAGTSPDHDFTDACQGDSGGPLVIKNDNNIFEVVGIVSWGFGCGSGVPGVYSRVFTALEWIDDKIVELRR